MSTHKDITGHDMIKRNQPSGGCWVCYKATQRKIRSRSTAAGIKLIREHKLSVGCAKCGYKEHHAGLDLDHIIPLPRKYKPALSLKSARDTIADPNIQVLCKICHGIKTFENKEYKKKEEM